MARRTGPVTALVVLALLVGAYVVVRQLRGGSEPSSAADSGTPAAVSPATGPAADVLLGLPVRVRAPSKGYSRAQFGEVWSDDVDVPLGHNGCDTREDILRRDLTDVVLRPDSNDCIVVSGTLADPYSGTVIAFRRGPASGEIQIDHVRALFLLWRTGAQDMPAQVRRDIANDPLELLAVDGQVNQDKLANDAAAWLPADAAYRCPYVARIVAVVAKYRAYLWVTASEKQAMLTVLAGCPGQPLPAG